MLRVGRMSGRLGSRSHYSYSISTWSQNWSALKVSWPWDTSISDCKGDFDLYIAEIMTLFHVITLIASDVTSIWPYNAIEWVDAFDNLLLDILRTCVFNWHIHSHQVILVKHVGWCRVGSVANIFSKECCSCTGNIASCTIVKKRNAVMKNADFAYLTCCLNEWLKSRISLFHGLISSSHFTQ